MLQLSRTQYICLFCRMDYLVWYREALRIPVQNRTRVELIQPLDPTSTSAGFRVTVRRTGSNGGGGGGGAGGEGEGQGVGAGAGEGALYARKVVLATGIQGGGEW